MDAGMTFDPSGYDIRCEWGLAGVETLGPVSDVIVIVDVLTFSTAVDVAVARGAAVLPYRWKDERRTPSRPRRAPFSPTADRREARLLALARIAAIHRRRSRGRFASTARVTFAACLRNCEAVAARAAARLEDRADSRRRTLDGRHAAPVPRRPARRGARLPGRRSPEAQLAIAAFERFRHDLRGALRE